jgi:hypothetical protein
MLQRTFLALSMLAVAVLLAGSGDPPKAKVDVPADVHVDAGTSRAWALMTCSVPFARDNFRHDLLAGAEMKEGNVLTLRKLLEEKYQVKRRIDLVDLIEARMKDGLRAQEVSLFKGVRDSKVTEADLDALPKSPDVERVRVLLEHAKRMEHEKDGLMAYDYVRAIVLCRFGYGAGYFTEAETWKRIEPIAKKLQKAYPSWEALGEIYAIGEDVFDNHLADKTWETWKKLKDDEKSPWKTVEWALPLASLAKPEPAPKK